MFNPLIPDLSEIKTTDLEAKINELSKKYFIAARSGNGSLANQIVVALDMYKAELRVKHLAASQVAMQNGNKDLDDLIKIS
jgi:hypothetical protein